MGSDASPVKPRISGTMGDTGETCPAALLYAAPNRGPPSMDLKDHIRGIPDFPQPGILFYDISTLLRDADAWQVAMGRMARAVRAYMPDLVAGVESRGFLIAAPLALQLGCGVIMIRKQGKPAGPTVGLKLAQ